MRLSRSHRLTQKYKIMPQKPSNETATITRLSHDGRGVAYINGKTIFLQGGLPGEIVRFSVTRKHASFDEGQVIEVIEKSAERVDPHCAYFSICGGCHLQHLQHTSQVTHKQNVLLEFLQHQAGVRPLEILPPIESETWGYRRKARLSVKYVEKKNKVLVGFREKSSRYVASIDSCSILPKKISDLLPAFSELFFSLRIRDQIPQMEVALTEKEDAVIIRHLAPFSTEDLQKIREFMQQHQIKCYLQPGGPDTIHLDWPKDSDPFLSYTLPELDLIFRFSPQQFVQINANVNQKMVHQALQLMELKPTDRVLDLFCGLGNFSLPLAKYCGEVVGVEGDRQAVQSAKENAVLNHLSNTEFFYEDLTQANYNKAWSGRSYDKLLLDPPRSGAKEVIAWIPQWKPSRIVYISCNPATLARDAQLLIQQGYVLAKAGAIDMFPHTQHTEAMALFIRN